MKKSGHVLLVEPDTLLLILMSDHLRALGYTVVEAGDTTEAFAVLEANSSIEIAIVSPSPEAPLSVKCLYDSISQLRPDVQVVIATEERAEHLPKAGKKDLWTIKRPYTGLSLERLLSKLSGEPHEET